jgi:hypothetical protein
MKGSLILLLGVLLLWGCGDAVATRSARPPVWVTHQALPGTPIHAVQALDGTRVAIGTRAGLMLWDETGTTIHTGPAYDPVQDKTIAGNAPLPGNEIAALVRTADGTAWIGTSHGLCSLRGTSFVDETKHLPPTWTGKPFVPNKPHESTDHDITCLQVAHDGRLLIGTRNAGLIVRSSDGQHYDVVHQHPDANQWVTGIAELPDGDFIVSVFGRGLLRFDGKSVAPFTTPDGWISTNHIRSLAATADGTLWAGTHHGLGMLRPDGKAKRFTTKDVLPDDTVWNLASDSQGRLWCFSSRSTAVLTGEGWRYPLVDGDPSVWLQGLSESPDGDQWFWTWTWVKRNPVLTWQTLRPDLQRLEVIKSQIATRYPTLTTGDDFVTVKDSDGRVWLSTLDRLFSYDGKTWKEIRLSPDEIVPLTFLHADHHGRVWIGTSGHGVVQIHHDKTTQFNHDPRHARSVVYCIAESLDGTLWLGTQDGLYTYGETGLKQVFAGYQVHPLFVEPGGRIWFGDINHGILTYQHGQIVNLSQQGALTGYQVSEFTLTADGDVLVDAYLSDDNQNRRKKFIVSGDSVQELPTVTLPPVSP